MPGCTTSASHQQIVNAAEPTNFNQQVKCYKQAGQAPEAEFAANMWEAVEDASVSTWAVAVHDPDNLNLQIKLVAGEQENAFKVAPLTRARVFEQFVAMIREVISQDVQIVIELSVRNKNAEAPLVTREGKTAGILSGEVANNAYAPMLEYLKNQHNFDLHEVAWFQGGFTGSCAFDATVIPKFQRDHTKALELAKADAADESSLLPSAPAADMPLTTTTPHKDHDAEAVDALVTTGVDDQATTKYQRVEWVKTDAMSWKLLN